MKPELAYKIGYLLATLNDFLVRVSDGTASKSDMDRMEQLSKDLKRHLFAAMEEHRND